MRFSKFIFAAALIAAVGVASAQQTPRDNSSSSTATTRTTLDNGLKVVIIRDPLAPVVTVETNYLVGADETPDGFPGMAHAQEHMAFRGCPGLTADQISAIFAQLGGYGNADTMQNITQYYSTIPAGDLDIALRVDSSCMQNIDDAQSEWAQEKGAIEQEVARDLSNPTYKFVTRMNEDMFSGTPYSHDALGTQASFDATTGEALKKFHDLWYAPNNAVLVIAGDVDPNEVLTKVKQYYGGIPRKDLPARAQVDLPTVKPESITLDSNLSYLLAYIAYRFPGTDDRADYAAVNILSDVLASQRGNLYALVPEGKALGAEFGLAEAYPKASVAYAEGALPAGGDSAALLKEMRQIISDYANNGVPADLVEASKRREIASAEYRLNSIPGLADAWSDALAAEGRNSPDDDIDDIRRVTVDDVNRVAKKYLVEDNSMTAELKPVPTGEVVAAKGFGGSEQTTAAPTKAVALPTWAASELLALKLPPPAPTATDTTLPNGLRLIVRTEKVTPTVTLAGSVRTNADLLAPSGQDGVDDMLGELFSYGTKTLDRVAYQKALDDIAADESAGFEFSLQTLKQDFSRGVQLLADNELNPALPDEAFQVIKPELAEYVAGEMKSPGYRFGRALTMALYPPMDPTQREATPGTVSSLTLQDVKDYYAKALRPDLTTIVIVGDITPDEAKAVIQKWFGDWRTSGAKPNVTLPTVPPNASSAVDVPDPSELQDTVSLSETMPMNRYNPDYYPLQLGNHVLGGGFYATRLYHDLRQVAGYVYTVDVALNAGRTRTVYEVSYACDPANVSKARQLIARDLVAMQQQEVSPAELQQAKALLLRQIPLTESDESSVAGGLLARAQLNLPLDELDRAAKQYFAISAAQVRAAFSKWLRPDGFVQIVRGPAPQ